MSFSVTATDDPLVWRVEEQFENFAVFKKHQERAGNSEWGQMTANIERRYTIVGHTQIALNEPSP